MQLKALPTSYLAHIGGIGATAAGIILFGVSWRDEDYVLRVSMMLFIGGVMVLGAGAIMKAFRTVTKPAEDAYDLGYQIGFDRGFLEGHATARPTVVPMASRSTCLECDDRHRREEFDAIAAMQLEEPNGVHKKAPIR